MRSRLAQLVVGQPQSVFAIMDGARDRSISGLLRESGFRHQSLYEGAEGEELAPFGPYLAQIRGSAESIRRWLDQALGRSFGVHLFCDQPFELVRRHLRRFLIVQLEDGRRVYFRFYDPRVLRAFLPGCTHEEWIQFFGPIETYVVESAGPDDLLLFHREADQPEPERLTLATAE